LIKVVPKYCYKWPFLESVGRSPYVGLWQVLDPQRQMHSVIAL
jgi:hypothetical protein